MRYCGSQINMLLSRGENKQRRVRVLAHPIKPMDSSLVKIRIASWNTWKNDGAYRRRIPAMITVLKKLQPDVLLLQESFKAETSSEALDTAACLAEALNMHVCFAPARDKVRAFEGEKIQSTSGHAILSKSPLESVERRELITTPEGGERIALFAKTQIQNTSLSLSCVHFAHRRGDGAIRTQQLSSVMEHLIQIRREGEISLIGGDFNMVIESPDFTDAIIPNDTTLMDIFGKAAVEQPTHPVPQRPNHPGRRIDLLLSLVPNDQPLPVILNKGISGTEYDETFATYPSDHALIWADLKA